MSGVASALFPVLVLLPIVDWMAAVLLVAIARSARPRIAVLTERAFGAVIVAIFTSIYVLIALNSERGFALLAFDGAVVVLRIGVIILGLAPLVWLFLWWRRR